MSVDRDVAGTTTLDKNGKIHVPQIGQFIAVYVASLSSRFSLHVIFFPH
jgi:hypothetical protein